MSNRSALALIENCHHSLASCLNLSDMGLTELPIELLNCTHITWLDLSHIQLTDITMLAKFSNLTKLELNNNQITDISPLVNLSKLFRLKLENNPIAAYEPLSKLTATIFEITV